MSTLNDSHLQLVFATNNIHKIEEVKHILGAGWEVLSLAESEIVSDLPENGDTLHANAEEKANAIHDQIALPCFAEDSGLEVDALGGAWCPYSPICRGRRKCSTEQPKIARSPVRHNR